MLDSDFAVPRQADSQNNCPGHADPITHAVQRAHARLAVRYHIVGSAMLLAPCPPLEYLAPLPPLTSAHTDAALGLPPSRLEQALAAFHR